MSIHKKYLKLVYKLWARIYDTKVDNWFKFDRRKVVSALKIKNKEHILEVGTGTGLILPYFPAKCTVTAVDFSQGMLSKAKHKKTKAKVHLSLQDAGNLTYKTNTFDKALTTYVLRVSPEPKKIIQEVSRVVKKNGLFVIIDQFQGKNKLLLKIMQPFKLLLGWGKEHDLNELIVSTPWTMQSNVKQGRMSNTRLVVLRNNK